MNTSCSNGIAVPLFFSPPPPPPPNYNTRIKIAVTVRCGISQRSHEKIGDCEHSKPFRDPGFALFESGGLDFKASMWARYVIESMHGMWDAEKSYQDYGIEQKFESG